VVWGVTLVKKDLAEGLTSLDGVSQPKSITRTELIHKGRVIVILWAAIRWEEEWECNPTTWEA
jgi:hypothetical protein